MPVPAPEEELYSTLPHPKPSAPIQPLSLTPHEQSIPKPTRRNSFNLEVLRQRPQLFGLTIRTMILIFTVVAILINTAYVFLGNKFLGFEIPEISLVGIGIVQVLIVISVVSKCEPMLKYVAYLLITLYALLLIVAMFCDLCFLASMIHVSQTNELPYEIQLTVSLVKMTLGYGGFWILLEVEMFHTFQLMLDLEEELGIH